MSLERFDIGYQFGEFLYEEMPAIMEDARSRVWESFLEFRELGKRYDRVVFTMVEEDLSALLGKEREISG